MTETETTGSTVLEGARILVIHPSAELYGSDRVLLESVRAMAAAGAAVTVSVPTEGPLIGALADTGATVLVLPTLVLRRRMLHPRGWAPTLALAVRSSAAGIRLMRSTRPDLVFVNTVTLPMWPVIARLLGAITVVHVHEAEDDVPIPLRFVLSLPARAAHHVVFNSKTSRDAMGARAAAKGTVIYNGVAGPGTVSAPRIRPDAPVRLLYWGRLSPRKGPDLAIDALALLRADGIDARLALLGDVFPGYEWFVGELEDLIRRHDLVGRVDRLGFRPDVWKAVEGCDIALIPSRRPESFGNTAIEALLAARPVIVGDVGGLVEAVDGAGSALVAPRDDAPALASRVREILSDWPRFRDAAVAGADDAHARYAPGRYRGEITALLHELLEARGQRAARHTDGSYRRMPKRSAEAASPGSDAHAIPRRRSSRASAAPNPPRV